MHAEIAKVIHGLPHQTSNMADIATKGWTTIKSYLDIQLMVFLCRIILLDMSIIYKKARIHRYVYHVYGEHGVHYGPLWNPLQTCKEYDLHNHIVHAIKDMPNMTITV